MYTWTRRAIADELCRVRAEKGVDVAVVIDNSNGVLVNGRWQPASNNDAVARLSACLGANLIVCHATDLTAGGTPGCNGPGINHNKFALFSALDDGSRFVVAQTSANLTASQLYNFNHLVVLQDSPKLYFAYELYWDDLRDQSDEVLGEVWGYRRHVDEPSAKVYLFPKFSGSDTVENILENVDCSARGPDGRRGRVHVAMAFFTDGRRNVAHQLRQMAAAGCEVKLVLRSDPTGLGDVATPGAGVRAEISGVERLEWVPMPLACRQWEGGNCTGTAGLHAKYFLVDAYYHGRWQQVVWSGSHNFTTGALRENDETLLRVADPVVYQRFLGDWLRLWQQAALIDRAW